ncbi:putative RNA-directed DNA polymerase from transposon BS [Trichonephila clavipes]|nr:putative RNA-directed DNA polymerase from transposon BS [Trichonephila clavipes]
MSWKTVVVILILKPGKNSTLAESYRPISLLPVLSKLAEKVILARLNDHLERENILIPEQHGFRPRLSTSHQLLRVVKFIKEGNNKDECTAAVFLDIQKPSIERLEAVRSKHSIQFINDHRDVKIHAMFVVRCGALEYLVLRSMPRSSAYWPAAARPIAMIFYQT